MSVAQTKPPREVVKKFQLPAKMSFLTEMHPYKVAWGGRSSMKCLGLGTAVMMADGSLCPVEDIRVGDLVMGPDSKPRTVLKTDRGVSDLYQIEQASGMTYVVNEAHILSLQKSAGAKLPYGALDPSRPVQYGRDQHKSNWKHPNGRYPSFPDVVNIGVKDYISQSAKWKTCFKGYRAGLIHLAERPVRIDPYFLGLWLGDGTGRELNITSNDNEIIDYCRTVAVANGRAISLSGKQGTTAQTIRFPKVQYGGRGSGKENPIWQAFRSYDLPDNKHIPEDYLLNSEQVRLQLLAGLIDTDGTRHGTSGYAISQVNEILARDIKRLAEGLGFRVGFMSAVTRCVHKGQTAIGKTWWLHIYGNCWRIPCLMPHKRIDPATKQSSKDFLQSSLTITPLGQGEYAGFELDGDHLFCLADGTVTHNSWSMSAVLLILGIDQSLRVLCCREVQRSIKDSVHLLLRDQIQRLELGGYYDITDEHIKCRNNDTLFRFVGLSDLNAESIKGYEGFDVYWFNEGQNIKRHSFQIALPTLFRTPNAELWVDFNPNLDTDEVWKRFVESPPEGAVVREMNWRDAVECGFWNAEQERLRLYDLKHSPLEYENIWEGKTRTTVAGAIYAPEVTEMIKSRRYGAVPYDPRFPVHRIWDLGWNDLMACVLVQKPSPTVCNIVGYVEDSHIGPADYVQQMRDLYRFNWGWDYLPHDGSSHELTSQTTPAKILKGLGCKVKIMRKTGPEDRIKAARSAFSRIYLDNGRVDTAPERVNLSVGGSFLMERLRNYRRSIPKTTGEPAAVLHDISSHGSDAFGALCEIVDSLRNEGEFEMPKIPGFRNVDNSMGMLG